MIFWIKSIQPLEISLKTLKPGLYFVLRFAAAEYTDSPTAFFIELNQMKS